MFRSLRTLFVLIPVLLFATGGCKQILKMLGKGGDDVASTAAKHADDAKLAKHADEAAHADDIADTGGIAEDVAQAAGEQALDMAAEDSEDQNEDAVDAPEPQEDSE